MVLVSDPFPAAKQAWLTSSSQPMIGRMPAFWQAWLKRTTPASVIVSVIASAGIPSACARATSPGMLLPALRKE